MARPTQEQIQQLNNIVNTEYAPKYELLKVRLAAKNAEAVENRKKHLSIVFDSNFYRPTVTLRDIFGRLIWAGIMTDQVMDLTMDYVLYLADVYHVPEECMHYVMVSTIILVHKELNDEPYSMDYFSRLYEIPKFRLLEMEMPIAQVVYFTFDESEIRRQYALQAAVVPVNVISQPAPLAVDASTPKFLEGSSPGFSTLAFEVSQSTRYSQMMHPITEANIESAEELLGLHERNT